MSQEEAGKHAPFVIEWRNGFKVNIDQVDQEHQHLFKLVKALNLGSVQQTVEELLDYVVVHFSNEQEMMEKSGYPAFEQHLKLHEEFATHVADFLGNGDPWTEERVQELRRFLNKWLVGHIMTHDLRFGKWYAEHPMKAAASIEVPQLPVHQMQAAKAHRGFFSALFGLK